MNRSRFISLWLLAACVCGCGEPASGGSSTTRELTPLERAGKRIYLRGESDSGLPVVAILGDPPMEVSAKMLPCLNCHGYGGQGIPEGGVIPSNITWTELTKSYGIVHASGRRHGPYDLDKLKRAITKGIDASDNKLQVGMPQFRMAPDDLTALVAYLKRIETDRDPGVTDSRITIATALPLTGPLGQVGRTIRDVLSARFDEVNARGGIYNRSIDLRVVPVTDSPEKSIADFKTVLETVPIFAVVAPFMLGAGDALAAVAAAREIPIIAPLGQTSDVLEGRNRFLFYLSAGLAVQARAIVDHFASQPGGKSPAQALLIAQTGQPFEKLAEVIKEQCNRRHIVLRVITYAAEDGLASTALAAEWTRGQAVFFVGPDADLVDALQEAANPKNLSHVYLLGALLKGDIFRAPDSYKGKLLAVFPNSSSARAPRALEGFRSFVARHGLDSQTSSSQLAAYCAATLMIEALEAAGRTLRREPIIRHLEGLYEYETGLMPPLTFGPNRRVGAYGGYIVSVDLASRAFVCNNTWVEPSP